MYCLALLFRKEMGETSVGQAWYEILAVGKPGFLGPQGAGAQAFGEDGHFSQTVVVFIAVV